jgi:predicted nucleotidyltransferase
MLEELVFVGGCTTALLITDEAAAAVRPTKDVDAVTELGSYAEYVRVADKLRALGFKEDQSEGAPMCRWRAGDLVLDVMPDDRSVLGFTNIWYKQLLKSSNLHELADDLTIRIVSAPYFVGTKLEAFKGRGKGDFQMSHDLEDLISVIDGRQTIVEEIRQTGGAELNEYVGSEIRNLFSHEDFIAALPGFLLPDHAVSSGCRFCCSG